MELCLVTVLYLEEKLRNNYLVVLSSSNSCWVLGKFLLRRSDNALKWSAQGSGGITIAGGVPEPFRCGTECRG